MVRATVEVFAKAGDDVALLSRDPDRLDHDVVSSKRADDMNVIPFNRKERDVT